MRIAVIGAGLAGLAVCWYLLERSLQVTLFDAVGIGGGTSGVSAGLLHPFTGQDARLAPSGREGMIATRELLQVAEKALGCPVAHQTGMLRAALTERQRESYLERSQQHPELHWLTAEETQKRVPGLVPVPGLWIREAISVDTSAYLEGLWQACQARGAELRIESVDQLELLKGFDAFVLALGAGHLPELAELPIRLLKGQILELAWPISLPPLPFPINSEAYLIPNPSQGRVWVGATFERQFADGLPNLALAEELLRPKAEALVPALRGAPLLGCRAGIRATTPSHQPMAKRIAQQVWVLTALGSKGLLHHAYLAKRLVGEIAGFMACE